MKTYIRFNHGILHTIKAVQDKGVEEAQGLDGLEVVEADVFDKRKILDVLKNRAHVTKKYLSLLDGAVLGVVV